MTEIPNRPYVHDEQVSAAVAMKLLPEALIYLEHLKDNKDGEVLKDLTELLNDSHEFDGYKLAKKLEDDFYWIADEELVDLMGSVGHNAYKICSDLVREWVKAHNIKPGHKVGDAVEWNRYTQCWREMKRGVIVEIREDEAVYIIQEEGKDYTSKEHKSGWVVNYEQVTDDQPWWTELRHAGNFFKPETVNGGMVCETDTKSSAVAADACSSS